MFSGGIGSWAAGRRVVDGGTVMTEVLFTDTLIEDEDLYRFLIEGAADLLDLPVPQELRPLWLSIPPLEEGRARKQHLIKLAAKATAALPGLRWIIEGRTPWEVFHDQRFLGNSGLAKCSMELKQKPARRWLEKHCFPHKTTIYLGIDWRGRHRFEGRDGQGGSRNHYLPWRAEAPLCNRPYESKHEWIAALERRGIDPPRLYDLGFPHNNCGGFCVKSGMVNFKRLLKAMPERYDYHARQEDYLRRKLGNVAILTDRRNRDKIPLNLIDFRSRVENGERCDPLDHGGCGCFTDYESADEVTR